MSDSHEASRGPRPGRLFPWIVGAFVLITVIILASMVTPVMPSAGPMVLSALGYALNPFLVVLIVLGALVAVLALRGRRRVLAAISIGASMLLVAAVTVPTAAITGAARERDIDLSLAAIVQGPTGGRVSPTDTVTYAEVDGTSLKMDVWRADEPEAASNAALIYVYGGGFESGTRTDWAPFFQHLTSQGISVFAMDYRLSAPGNPSWAKAPSDVACAVGWVKANAGQYDIDPERLALSGGSAGGNLALLTAYSANDAAITPSCETGDRNVRAVIDFYGPSDLAELHKTTPAAPVRRAIEQYTGTTPFENPDRYAALSPTTFVDQEAPPTLILHGGHDTGVPAEQSRSLSRQLEANGVDHKLIVLPATEHGFDGIYGSFANQIAQVEVSKFMKDYLTN